MESGDCVCQIVKFLREFGYLRDQIKKILEIIKKNNEQKKLRT